MKEMLSLHGHGPRVTLLPQFPSARTFQHFLPVTCKVSPSQVPPLGWFCSQWCPQTCAELTPDPFYPGLTHLGAAACEERGKPGRRDSRAEDPTGLVWENHAVPTPRSC